MLWVDAHCDTLLSLADTGAKWLQNAGHLDGARLARLGPGIQFMAAYTAPEYIESHQAFARVKTLLEIFHTLPCPKIFFRDDLPAQAPEDTGSPCLRAAGEAPEDTGSPYLLAAGEAPEDTGSPYLLAAVEGGEALEDSLSQLYALFMMGVRSLGLTWNHENSLSGGADTPERGLTDWGRTVIAQCEQLGVLVDAAHISPKGFWDVLQTAQKPPIVSHACCRALCDHPRNLTDAQIAALAQKGGVMGVCLYSSFLRKEGRASLEDAARHILHALSVGGEDAVGLGTDFDGCSVLPEGLPGVEALDALWALLSQKGVSRQTLHKIRGKNFLRVLRAILPGKGNIRP